MMIARKMFIIAAALSCMPHSHASYYPYHAGKNYLESYLSPAGGRSFTASSPELAQTLSQSGVSPTSSVIPTGMWALNQTKGMAGYYYMNTNNYFKNGVMALQSNGAFAIGGQTQVVGSNCAYFEAFTLTGAPIGSWTSNPADAARINAMVPDGSGGYYVAGAIDDAGASGGWVVQLTSAGLTNTAFNSGNVQRFLATDAPNYNQFVGIGRQSTGNIVVTGQTSLAASFSITRLLPNGTGDTSFATSESSVVSAAALALDSEDRILVTGANGGNIILYRFLADGGLDPSFGIGGAFDLPVNTLPTGLLVLADNSIIVVGQVIGLGQMRIVKVTAAGALDTTFGAGTGIVDLTTLTDPAGDSMAYSAASLPDGKIAVAGRVQNLAHSYFGIVMLTSTGSYDASFTVPGQMAGLVAGSVLAQPGNDSAAFGVGYQSVAGSTGLVITGCAGLTTPAATEGQGPGIVFYSNNG